jgi:hypothetical protein
MVEVEVEAVEVVVEVVEEELTVVEVLHLHSQVVLEDRQQLVWLQMNHVQRMMMLYKLIKYNRQEMENLQAMELHLVTVGRLAMLLPQRLAVDKQHLFWL